VGGGEGGGRRRGGAAAAPRGRRRGPPARGRDPVYVALNIDPTRAAEAVLHPHLPALGIDWDEPYRLTDLLSGETRVEQGADLRVSLDPSDQPYRIFSIRPLE
jgi:hypothetical protein